MARNSQLFNDYRNKSRGVGRQATEASFTTLRVLKGQRFTVTGDPASAIAVAVGRLLGEGFVMREADLETALRQRGSLWAAQTVEIGDAKLAKRLWWQNDIFNSGELSFLVGWAMRRGIAPTMVVAAARPVANRQTELVIVPVESGLGPKEDAGAAEPRLSRALAAVAFDFGQSGRLMHAEEPFILLDDPDCPAHRDVLPTLIRWP